MSCIVVALWLTNQGKEEGVSEREMWMAMHIDTIYCPIRFIVRQMSFGALLLISTGLVLVWVRCCFWQSHKLVRPLGTNEMPHKVHPNKLGQQDRIGIAGGRQRQKRRQWWWAVVAF